MNDPNSNENRRILYLEQIDIVTTERAFRVIVRIDNREVEMRHEQRTSIWSPNESLEFTDDSKITVVLKVGHTYKGISFGKLEARAEITSQEAIKSFWDSIDSISSRDSISRSITLGQHPIAVTFKFRPSKTSEDIRAAVGDLQKKMENFRAIMAGTMERHVDNALKLGVTLAEMDPTSKLAVGLAKSVFEVFKEQRKYDEMTSDLASAVDRIVPFAKRALEEVLKGDGDLLEGVIRRLYELIADIAKFICGYTKRGRAFHMLRSMVLPEDQLKIKSLHDKFSLLEKDFDRAVSFETLTLARKNEIDRLLKLLKPVREANYQEDRGCMEGTRTAVLDNIIAWVNKPPDQDEATSSHSGSVYWLYGMPGLGKTSVANSLCHRLHKTGNLGGSFFCKRDEEILREPKNILPTFISKLAGMWAPYKTLVAQALQDDPHLNPKSTKGDLLLKCLRGLEKPPPRTLVLVIDAFDECGEDTTRESLLKVLFEACSEASWLKVIITSRPEYDIQSFFETHPCTNQDLAEDDHTGKDILYFAQERMQLLAKSRKQQLGWPGEERMGQITQRSHGLFIYIDTIYRILKPFKNLDEKLDLVLGEQQQDANSELHNLYLAALKSQVGQETEEFCRVARAIIAAATYRPLSDETLASLIGKVLSVAQTWVDALGWVFLRERSLGGGIRVRHLSIFEFLTGLRDPAELRVDLKQAHEDLSLYCLRTMIKGLKFNICGLKTSYLANCDIENLDDLVQRSIPDALQYSCLHWASHLCADLDPPSEAVCELLKEFFGGEWPVYWLEVLSVTGNIPAAIGALQTIVESSKKLEGQIRLHIEDLLRFTHAFSTPISTSAPHIYVSALPFMPRESNLWKNVHELFPNILNVCQGRTEKWPGLATIWREHSDTVESVAYSPNGLFVVSGSWDATLRIWDATTGTVVGEPLRGHTNGVNSVAYSPNGQFIVSGSNDKTIRIWDAKTGAAVGEPLRGHTEGVDCVAYSPNGEHIVSGSSDGTIRIWDANTGTAVGEPLGEHTSGVAYSPDGQYIVFNLGGEMVIWNAKTGASAGGLFGGHTGGFSSFAYSPDGQHIVSGCGDKTVRIWDTKTGAVVGDPLRGHTDLILSVAYSPNGEQIVSSSLDKTIRIWDAKTGAAVGEPLIGHTKGVGSLAYSPNGQHIVSGSDDRTIRIWDAKKSAAAGEPPIGHFDGACSVAYSPDGQNIVSDSLDDTIQIWDAKTGAAVGDPLRGHTDLVRSVAYSPNGEQIVSSSRDKTLRIWDAKTGAAVGEPLIGHTNNVGSLAYSPNGQHIVSGSGDHTIRIWDAKTGAAVGEPLRGHTDYVNSVAYSPNGEHIVSGSNDETIRIWDANMGTAMGEPLSGHTHCVRGVAYSPNGQHIVSGSMDITIRIWDAKPGVAEGESPSGHTEWIQAATYSPMRDHITFDSRDSTIPILEWRPLPEVSDLMRSDSDWIRAVAYSPNGEHVIFGSKYGTIQIWDTKTGAIVGEPLSGHTDVVSSVAYSPDGKHIVSCSYDKTIRIWDAKTIPGTEDNAMSSSQPFPNRSGDTRPSLAPYPSSLAFASNLPISKSLIDSRGWVRCAEGLLLWIPDDCRTGIASPTIILIPSIGYRRCVRVDFTHFRCGSSWTEAYRHL